jgi:3'(2'), 5'-bisphosphate nucleotidase
MPDFPLETIVQDLPNLIIPLIELSRLAGDAICRHYHSAEAGEFEAKGDESPLTRADLDSHAILSKGLEALDSAIPVLSEESTSISATERMAWPRYWLVDPLDGTKEFLARTGQFTINIALINDHIPELGLLYLPLEHKAYVGIPGVGAHCYEYRPEGKWHDRKLSTRPLVQGAPMTVLASFRHRGPRLEEAIGWLQHNWGALERENSGSALKFCQLAEGRGDFYPRFSPCCEWDTAAGQAVLEAAGGQLLGMDGKALRYNERQSLYSPDFYGIGDAEHPLWQALLSARF